MNRTLVVLLAGLVGLTTQGVRAQDARRADVQLKAAQHKADVQGDCKGAIAIYQTVVDKYAATDKGAASTALLRMAECYQLLGDAQAKRIYERIVRDFSSERDAVAIARMRLGGAAGAARSSGMAARQIWTGPKVDVVEAVTRDGHALVFPDWQTGNLALHDITTGIDRDLTNTGKMPNTYAGEIAITRDGMKVAYGWSEAGQFQLRIVDLGAAGQFPTPRIVVNDPDISWIKPYDWSPDGRSIAVDVVRKDRTAEMGVVSAEGGTVKFLRREDWNEPTRAVFSPNGQFIAFELPIAPGGSQQRDVYVMTPDARRETPVVVDPHDDRLVDWSPDGRSLLFLREGAELPGLWSVAVTDGRPTGRPTLIKSNLGSAVVPIGLSASGTLLYGTRTAARGIHVAEVDFATGKTLGQPKPLNEKSEFVDGQGSWSPDGRSIAYLSEGSRGASVLRIHSFDSSQTRELLPRMEQFARPRLLPDGSLLLQGRDANGRSGIFLVDPKSGDASFVSDGAQASVSSDGRFIVCRRGYAAATAFAPASAIVLHDLRTAEERTLVTRPGLFGLALSPDDRQIAFIETDTGRKTSSLTVMPVTGGDARVVYTANSEHGLPNFLTWTPDGRRLVFAGKIDATANESTLWSIPVSGGSPTKLELTIQNVANLWNPSIHPDGRRIAFSAGEEQWELWALENFLPRLPAAKK
jgi:Tol biopolymer transport system component